MAETPLLLLPTPTQVALQGGWLPMPATSTWTVCSPLPLPPGWEPAADGMIQVVSDPTQPAQGYVLTIGTSGIEIRVGAAAGVRHALATLTQIRRQHPERLPTLTITDAPLFAVRGAMLDVSRDRIPTMAEFARMIPQLAEWKFNHLQLYVEHTVAYAGHEAAWQGLDPLTPDELKALDALCAAHGIELAANQNCFGHLSGFLKLPAYQHLAEIAVDGTWDFNGLVTRTGPFSLCPSEPGAKTFVADLLRQLCPLIASQWVNIGCDETFDVGQGRSQAAVAARGRAEVYLDFVRQICALVAAHGKRPQFWADIALEHPEHLAELPADLLGLAWGYEGDADFARWCDQLRAANRDAWVCPGTSSWRSITGRTTDRSANLLAAVAAHAHGASGFLVTDWGDLGHRQHWPIAAHGLAEAAHRAWSGTAPYDSRASGLHALGNPALGPWLDELGDLDRDLRLIGGKLRPDGSRAPLRNATALFTDLHLTTAYIGTAGTWQELGDRLAALAQRRPLATDPLLEAELAHTLAVADFACARAIARRAGQPPPHTALHAVIAEYRRLWPQRSRQGGLAASSRHYEQLMENAS